MIFDFMADVQADDVSMCEAHPDLEVFRLRLGRAINYKFNEDSQIGLFQRKDPREGVPPRFGVSSTHILSDVPQVALLLTLKDVLQATT